MKEMTNVVVGVSCRSRASRKTTCIIFLLRLDRNYWLGELFFQRISIAETVARE